MSGPQVLGIMAARLVGRPVKLVLRREQMFGPVGHRAPTRQTLRLGTDRDGALTALDHHTKTASSTFDDFFEPAAEVSQTLYASPAIATTHEAVRARYRHAAVHARSGRGHRLDRARERHRRDGAGLRHGSAGVPAEELCRGRADLRQAVFVEGVARVLSRKAPNGSAGRAVRSRRGRCATMTAFLSAGASARRRFPALMFQAEARAVLRDDGSGVDGDRRPRHGAGRLDGAGPDRGRRARPRSSTRSSSGPGTSDLPDAGIAGGSAHTATAGMAIHNAGADVIAKLADLATGDERSPLFGAGNAGVDRARRPAVPPRRREPQRKLCRDPRSRRARGRSKASGRARPDPAAQQANYAMHAHGAVFAEVKVDPDLGQIRVTRLVGAFAAGRIINPRLVRSQYLWRHDLGRLVRAARTGHRRPPLRPRHERQTSPSTMSR